MRIQPLDTNKLAKTGQEYLDLLASDADWIARSADDVRALRTARTGAFAKLPDSAFEEFVASLTFSKGGLGHANYKPLMSTLALSEIFEIFGYFGLSPIHALDREDYYCQSAGTCTRQLFSFCTSSC